MIYFRSTLIYVVLMTCTGTTFAETQYVAVVHIFTTKGTYERHDLTATQEGVNLTECQFHKDAWWAENGPSLDVTQAELAKLGLYTKTVITCEAK